MRGDDERQSGMYSYVTMEQRIAADHPARSIRAMVDGALERMDAELSKLYSTTGRPSIAPERLLRAQLLMVLYSIRSERQLMEQLNYNLLFRWFVGLEMDDPVWDVTVFTKNRERLIAGAASQQLLLAVIAEARRHESAERGAFHGGWHAASGLGFAAQLHGPPRSTGAGIGLGSEGRGTAARSHPVDERRGGAAVQEVEGRQVCAVLSGPRADGQPPRAGGGSRGQPGGPGCGARDSVGDDGPDAKSSCAGR